MASHCRLLNYSKDEHNTYSIPKRMSVQARKLLMHVMRVTCDWTSWRNRLRTTTSKPISKPISSPNMTIDRQSSQVGSSLVLFLSLWEHQTVPRKGQGSDTGRTELYSGWWGKWLTMPAYRSSLIDSHFYVCDGDWLSSSVGSYSAGCSGSFLYGVGGGLYGGCCTGFGECSGFFFEWIPIRYQPLSWPQVYLPHTRQKTVRKPSYTQKAHCEAHSD